MVMLFLGPSSAVTSSFDGMGLFVHCPQLVDITHIEPLSLVGVGSLFNRCDLKNRRADSVQFIRRSFRKFRQDFTEFSVLIFIVFKRYVSYGEALLHARGDGECRTEDLPFSVSRKLLRPLQNAHLVENQHIGTVDSPLFF